MKKKRRKGAREGWKGKGRKKTNWVHHWTLQWFGNVWAESLILLLGGAGSLPPEC